MPDTIWLQIIGVQYYKTLVNITCITQPYMIF